jgi:ABC-2 type transport system ATP-binding protein
MNPAIETNELVKRYGDVTAVDHLSIRVDPGEIYAFLGLNGAGKTTTIRLMLGMIKPTSGSASVLQSKIRLANHEPWASVGYLVETARAYPELTVVDNLEVARRLHPGTAHLAIGQIVERLGLTAYANRRAGNLSLGNLQRLGLAKALLHNPRLLILDEPANGLDPAGIVEIREMLLGLARDQGVTIFMSSHILGEVSRLAGRIGIIHQGRLLQEMDVDEMERSRRRRLVLRTRDIEAARAALVAAGRPAEVGPGDKIVLNDATSIERPDDIASLLVGAGLAPTHLAVEEEDLEQYFLRLVGVNAEGKHE